MNAKPELRRGWTTGACATAAALAAYEGWVAGQFPDPVTIRLPVDGAELEITCKFELLPGSVPLRTSTRVAAPAHADGVVPVDIEACGSLAR